MSLEDLQEALDLIDELGGDFEGEKSTSLLNKAEGALDLTFPPSYRTFLTTLGCGDIEGLEFFGLIGEDFENSGVPDAIWLTMEERKASGLPSYFVLVYARGDGVYYALDTSRSNNDGECPVVSYNGSGEYTEIANSYGEFLLSEIKTIMS